MAEEPRRYAARWVVPLDGEPIENGVVEVTDERITAIHDRPDPGAESLGNAAIVPAFVNAHTHLEFSDLDAPLEPSRPFTDWIRRLMAYRGERAVSVPEAVRLGLRESAEAGTGLVGEIATEGWSPAPFSQRKPAGIVFRELIGLGEERFASQIELAREHLAGGASRGLSPHAPYTVHPELLRALVEVAAEHAAPVAIHVAETVAELELLHAGTGEIAEMLRSFGVPFDDALRPGSRPRDYIEPLLGLERALVVHGNHLADDELALLAANPQVALVFCPRTHGYFGHAGHPWRQLLAAGGTVAIGTDGRGSNPDLSVFHELQFLHERFPDVPPRTLLELGTLNGARALGRATEFGILAVDRPAHMTVVSLPEATNDPYAAILDGRSCVTGTPSN